MPGLSFAASLGIFEQRGPWGDRATDGSRRVDQSTQYGINLPNDHTAVTVNLAVTGALAALR
jgi:hypothetical protein